MCTDFQYYKNGRYQYAPPPAQRTQRQEQQQTQRPVESDNVPKNKDQWRARYRDAKKVLLSQCKPTSAGEMHALGDFEGPEIQYDSFKETSIVTMLETIASPTCSTSTSDNEVKAAPAAVLDESGK